MRAFACLLCLLGVSAVARAEVLQAPQGGRAFPLGRARVLCGPVPDGWSADGGGRLIRPPAGEGGARSGDVRVALDPQGCAQSRESLTLQVTGRWPEIDPSSIVFFPDEGRLELKGLRLAGVQVVWKDDKREGGDRCLAPALSGRVQSCVVPLERGLPMDAQLLWLPAGGRSGSGVTTFDASGRPSDPALFVLHPARTVIAQLLPAGSTVDISQPVGKLALVHPKAVGSVDCGLARCEVGEGGVIVRGVPGLATQLTVQIKLAPRVVLQRGDKIETSVSASVPLLHCPLSVVSGLPLRDADETQILVKMDERCSRDLRLRWTVGAEPAEVVRAIRVNDVGYAQLRVGRIASGSVTITATRADSDGGIVGSVTTKTAAAPRPYAVVELPGFGRIDFIPTNRAGLLSIADPGQRASLVALPIDGIYTVKIENGRTMIRGDQNAGGLASMRFGYRVEGLPAEFASINVAVLTEAVQRPVREASVPVPLGITADRRDPIVEFVCADRHGNPTPLVPGKPARIPFDARQSCRVTLHQERLRPEDGLQEIVLEVDVRRPDGTKRGEASVDERLVLRPGGESRTFYVKEVTQEFDHVVVRVSHVLDETRYVLSPGAHQFALPSIQWSAIVEGGRVRLYATVAIPAGLYRMNEPTGQLSLNFGVLSRLTWLDRHGKEGLLGMELGLMGVGLIPQKQGTVAIPRTLAAVAGLGIRIELGAGAAVGVHLWGAYEFREEYHYGLTNPSDPTSGPLAPHWAVFFGPSIAIGNAGTNL